MKEFFKCFDAEQWEKKDKTKKGLVFTKDHTTAKGKVDDLFGFVNFYKPKIKRESNFEGMVIAALSHYYNEQETQQISKSHYSNVLILRIAEDIMDKKIFKKHSWELIKAAEKKIKNHDWTDWKIYIDTQENIPLIILKNDMGYMLAPRID
jgi:hypothetical protein